MVKRNLRTQFILAFALMLFGFGMAMQLRSHERVSERLEAQSDSDLVEIIDTLDHEVRVIRDELGDTNVKLAAFKNSESSNQEMLEKAKSEIVELQQFSGEKKVAGPGIAIRIKDKQHLLTGFDLRQIVEEFRSLGAWAIAINGTRLDYRSNFYRKSGVVFLDEQKLKPDYRIEAIGEAKLLYQTVTMARGIRDKLNTLNGITVKITRGDTIELGRTKNRSKWQAAHNDSELQNN